jgi:hypothetical protein
MSSKQLLVRYLTSSKLFEPNSTPIHFSTDISSSGVIFKDVLPGGQLIEVKKLMPNVIKSIVMCYKGFCGIHCQINSYVCAAMISQVCSCMSTTREVS